MKNRQKKSQQLTLASPSHSPNREEVKINFSINSSASIEAQNTAFVASIEGGI